MLTNKRRIALKELVEASSLIETKRSSTSALFPKNLVPVSSLEIDS